MILELRDFGSKPNVFSSISLKIGLALTNLVALTVETKVNDGTIISSLVPNPYARKDACKADVPEFNV